MFRITLFFFFLSCGFSITIEEIRELKEMGFTQEQIVKISENRENTSEKKGPNDIVTFKLYGRGLYGFTPIFEEEKCKIAIIDSNSLAEKSGLQVGDRIISINNKRLTSKDDLLGDHIYKKGPNKFVIERNGKVQIIKIDYKPTSFREGKALNKFYKMNIEDQIICAFLTGWKKERKNKIFEVSEGFKGGEYIIDTFRVFKKGKQAGGLEEEKWIYYVDVDGRNGFGMAKKYTLVLRFTTKPKLVLLTMAAIDNSSDQSSIYFVYGDKLTKFDSLEIDDRVNNEWDFNFSFVDYSKLME